MNQSSRIIRKWLWMVLLAILSISVYAQKKVEGQITDNNGVPLSGVLVAEIYSGKNYSGDIVQSRDDGKFTVVINKKGSSLYITNIGYKPQEIRNIADSTGLIHGGNEKQWLEMTKPDLPQMADRDSVIFVCPDAKNSWYWDSPKNPAYRYETFVYKELVTAIDAKYPTIKDRSARAITGFSMGGHDFGNSDDCLFCCNVIC